MFILAYTPSCLVLETLTVHNCGSLSIIVAHCPLIGRVTVDNQPKIDVVMVQTLFTVSNMGQRLIKMPLRWEHRKVVQTLNVINSAKNGIPLKYHKCSEVGTLHRILIKSHIPGNIITGNFYPPSAGCWNPIGSVLRNY